MSFDPNATEWKPSAAPGAAATSAPPQRQESTSSAVDESDPLWNLVLTKIAGGDRDRALALINDPDALTQYPEVEKLIEELGSCDDDDDDGAAMETEEDWEKQQDDGAAAGGGGGGGDSLGVPPRRGGGSHRDRTVCVRRGGGPDGRSVPPGVSCRGWAGPRAGGSADDRRAR
mmetsp:Transcript_31312/g.69349  ORF Transcript_31312/g.69349 Transcript_31312/m.69349 type:complete len:173 (-) Transcript_31312:7390-7908(-)